MGASPAEAAGSSSIISRGRGESVGEGDEAGGGEGGREREAGVVANTDHDRAEVVLYFFALRYSNAFFFFGMCASGCCRA